MRPPRSVVAGGTGFVGRFVVERLLAEGHEVTVASRTPPPEGCFSAPVRFARFDLAAGSGHEKLLAGVDCLVHAAFDHLPGRYRGGEGQDPAGFRRRNLDGSLALFDAAKAAGVKRAVFVSSRAVYGERPDGAELTEGTIAHPQSLYGEVKLACEKGLQALADARFRAASLRVTGVYGPAGPRREHKWAGLVADYLAGRPVPSHVGTEVHGEDVAWAALIATTAPPAADYETYNVSDIVVDNAEILEIVRDVTASASPLPQRADAGAINVMSTRKLRALGWRPGGRELFVQTVRDLMRAVVSG